MTGNKIIIGLTGLIASGKGAAAKYYKEKYGASIYRFSTILRDLVDRIYVEQTRDILIKMSECVRAVFGEDILAKAMAKDAEKDPNPFIIIEGIRRLADIEYLSKLPNFVLVEIFADPAVRHERLVKRGENADDKTKTFEQFLEDHKRSTEMSILVVAKEAKERVDNNGDFEKLYKQLGNLAQKYASKN